MAGTTTTTNLALAKEIVDEGMSKGFKESIGLAQYLGAKSGGDIEVNDRGVRFSTYLRPNPSFGTFSQGAAFPSRGAQTIIAGSCTYARLAMAASITGDGMKQMAQASMLPEGKLAELIERDSMAFMNNVEQLLVGNGNGMKAIRNATAISGTTATFYTTVAGGSTYGVRQLKIGGRYNFVNPTTLAIKSGGGTSVSTVTALNDSGATATFDAIANDTADGDLLVHENTAGVMIRGLDYPISSNALTVYNIDRSVYPEFNSNVFDAGAATMSFSYARRMDHILNVRGDDGLSGKVDKWMSASMEQALEEVYHPLVRVPSDSGDAKIGFSTYDIGGVRVGKLHWSQDDRIWYTKRDTWRLASVDGSGPKIYTDAEGKMFFLEPQVASTGSSGDGTYRDNNLMFHVFRGDWYCKSPRENGVAKNFALGAELVRPYSIGR